MKITRVILTAGAGALAGVLALSGCSAQGSDAPDAKITLSYVIWDSNALNVYKETAKAFQDKHPNITVNIQALPWDQYWTKLQTQASSKTLPDLFWINEPNFKLYAQGGAIEPLTALEKSGDFDRKDYAAAQLASYTIDDQVYAAPSSFATMGVWYNARLFQEAGVEEPREGWTLDDFQKDAAAISAALGSKGVFGAASAPNTNQETYYNTIYQSGGHVISEDGKKSGYDDPATIAGVKVWVDLIRAGAAPSVQQLNDTPAAQYFTSGRLAMMWSGPWNANSLKDSVIAADVKLAPMPKGPSDLVTTIQGGADAVSAFSPHKEAAQQFQAFLASEEGQTRYAKAGLGIPAFTQASGAFLDAFPDWDLKIFVDEAQHAAPYPVSLNTAAWNKLEADYLTKAYSGSETVEKACAELAEAMNAALAQEGE